MNDGSNKFKPKSVFQSINFAFEGLLHAFKVEKHIRYHFIVAVIVLIISLVLRLPAVDFAIFSFSVILLIFAEMVNTAVEEVVNLLEDKHNIIARNAKDISAGAVLVAAIGVIITFVIIFSKFVAGPAERLLGSGARFEGHLVIISILLVLIAVLVLKTVVGKGRPLHGGFPSGHSAAAFSLWASISLISMNPVVIVIAFVMAMLVSQSRLLGGIHTWLEVVLGALLGVLLTGLVFYIYSITEKIAFP